MNRNLYILFFLSLTVLLNAQYKGISELETLARKNRENFKNNSNSTFINAQKIQKDAVKSSNHVAELIAISTQCLYYEKQNNFKELIITAQSLSEKARLYDELIYSAIAKDYLFRAYVFSGLKEKGLQNLKEGLSITDKIDDKNDSTYIDTQSNLLTSFSNYYSLEKKPREQLKYIRLAILEHQKFQNSNYKKKLKFLDYSNLAVVYNDINIDSAAYFAKIAMDLDQNFAINNASFTNFLIIGTTLFKKGDLKNALYYLQKAEKIKDNNNHLNVELLYELMAKTYIKLNNTSNGQKYRIKLDSVKLSIAEKQNQSLHKIITDKVDVPKQSSGKIYILLFSGLLIVVIGVFLFLRKKKTDDFVLNHPIENNSNSNNNEIEYSRLMEMFKKNDIAFMPYFNECFPEFAQKLTEINPKIIQTEIEFCALLKLNIPTKDIVRFKNLAHRTVQNKKYLIRKKLDIPSNVDIYQWFSNI